jgi:serine/threonine protein kinase
MIAGRLPFPSFVSAGEVVREILYGVITPPRQINSAIPTELERICLRCLSRQMSERYRTASDLADDLSEWLRSAGGASDSSSRKRPLAVEPPDAPVVPRGLRSFEQEDADFFLKLLPGPRDRHGLPTALRFWKRRIEEREAEHTFRVGMLWAFRLRQVVGSSALAASGGGRGPDLRRCDVARHGAATAADAAANVPTIAGKRALGRRDPLVA